jgi:hypothetical protein
MNAIHFAFYRVSQATSFVQACDDAEPLVAVGNRVPLVCQLDPAFMPAAGYAGIQIDTLSLSVHNCGRHRISFLKTSLLVSSVFFRIDSVDAPSPHFSTHRWNRTYASAIFLAAMISRSLFTESTP